MPDPFGSMQNMMNQFQRFQQNPMEFLMRNRMNIPAQYQNDPNGAIQYLMNTGQLTQQQYNWAKQMAGRIQNNPAFVQMFGRR